MEYLYSFIGAENYTGLTRNPTILNGVAQLVEKFTSSIFQDNKIEETFSQSEYNFIEIPVFTIDGYSTIRPIKINIECINDDEYIAIFEEAGISFSANTVLDAIQEFKVEFIEVYKCYKAETCLGSWPKHQLAVLESYIGKKK
jgi:hypothetical protein